MKLKRLNMRINQRARELVQHHKMPAALAEAVARREHQKELDELQLHLEEASYLLVHPQGHEVHGHKGVGKGPGVGAAHLHHVNPVKFKQAPPSLILEEKILAHVAAEDKNRKKTWEKFHHEAKAEAKAKVEAALANKETNKAPFEQAVDQESLHVQKQSLHRLWREEAQASKTSKLDLINSAVSKEHQTTAKSGGVHLDEAGRHQFKAAVESKHKDILHSLDDSWHEVNKQYKAKPSEDPVPQLRVVPASKINPHTDLSRIDLSKLDLNELNKHERERVKDFMHQQKEAAKEEVHAVHEKDKAKVKEDKAAVAFQKQLAADAHAQHAQSSWEVIDDANRHFKPDKEQKHEYKVHEKELKQGLTNEAAVAAHERQKAADAAEAKIEAHFKHDKQKYKDDHKKEEEAKEKVGLAPMKKHKELKEIEFRRRKRAADNVDGASPTQLLHNVCTECMSFTSTSLILSLPHIFWMMGAYLYTTEEPTAFALSSSTTALVDAQQCVVGGGGLRRLAELGYARYLKDTTAYLSEYNNGEEEEDEEAEEGEDEEEEEEKRKRSSNLEHFDFSGVSSTSSSLYDNAVANFFKRINLSPFELESLCFQGGYLHPYAYRRLQSYYAHARFIVSQFVPFSAASVGPDYRGPVRKSSALVVGGDVGVGDVGGNGGGRSSSSLVHSYYRFARREIYYHRYVRKKDTATASVTGPQRSVRINLTRLLKHFSLRFFSFSSSSPIFKHEVFTSNSESESNVPSMLENGVVAAGDDEQEEEEEEEQDDDDGGSGGNYQRSSIVMPRTLPLLPPKKQRASGSTVDNVLLFNDRIRRRRQNDQ